MNDLLIPFGVSNVTRTFVEPDDAEQGRSCDCHCPGCETPLLSRHPKDHRRIHFAHDSRHPDAVQSIIDKCPFNSELAIALMARHVASRLIGQSINLPSHQALVDFGECGHESYTPVAREQRLAIVGADSEVIEHRLNFDLQLQLGKYQVLVWLNYKDRPADLVKDINPDAIQSTKGILSIDIQSFNQKAFRNSKQRFSEAVIEFLLSSGSRDWLRHPDTEAAVEKARKRHYCNWESSVAKARREMDEQDDFVDISVMANPKPAAPAQTSAGYLCLMCQTKWTQTEPGAPNCPKGCGHLYARPIDS